MRFTAENFQQYLDRNTIELFTKEGVRYIKLWGYAYHCESADGKDYRRVEFRSWETETPLSELPTEPQYRREYIVEEIEMNVRQYIADITADEVPEFLNEYGVVGVADKPYEELSDGVYIDA